MKDIFAFASDNRPICLFKRIPSTIEPSRLKDIVAKILDMYSEIDVMYLVDHSDEIVDAWREALYQGRKDWTIRSDFRIDVSKMGTLIEI